MVRQVNIVVPLGRADEILEVVSRNRKIHGVQLYDTMKTSHISFKVRGKHLQDVMEAISDTGCGVNFGTIDVISLVMTRPILKFKEPNTAARAYRISDRMSVDEIHDAIDEGNHLTFDYMSLIATASVIAGAGLLTNNATTIIASMLVSPLMGPILSITFGIATLDYGVIKRGLRNETWGVVISLIVGVIMGLCAGEYYKDDDLRSDEMIGRGQATNLLMGFVVAAPSGVGVILAVSMGGVNAIVGTAISASLLPPVVNTGICLGMALIYAVVHPHMHNATFFANLAWVSFMLWFMNFVVIVITGFLTFRYIKNVHPPVLNGPKKSVALTEIDNTHRSFLLNNKSQSSNNAASLVDAAGLTPRSISAPASTVAPPVLDDSGTISVEGRVMVAPTNDGHHEDVTMNVILNPEKAING